MSLAAKLGLPEDAKIVVGHQDDIGMCHGANMAFLDLVGKGVVTCSSVMVPCPWFLEVAEIAARRPDLDIGIHLTLTSERNTYRWRPLLGTSPATGLVDGDGYMWRSAKEVREHADPKAVEDELRLQVEAVRKAGIRATHLDAHMGTVFAPEFIDIYLQLGEELDLPVLYTKFWNGDAAKAANAREQEVMERSVRRLEARGNPIFPEGIETPWIPSAGHRAVYESIIDRIGPGLTFLSLHPNRPGDIETIDPDRYYCRTDEWRLFQDEAFIARVRERGLHMVGFRELGRAMRGGTA
ncbi:MAG: polysaccharide deacetylase family protein [Geminicoccaceae bacterium]